MTNSARALILRFSDRETDTIEAHRSVISQHKSVWWGWWKKAHEKLPPAGVLPAGQLDPPLTVGLLRRKPNQALYVAACSAVIVLSGEPLAAPQAELVPEYYRGDDFPGWFRLTELRNVDEDEWIALFGGVPEGDPTLYWVTGEEAELSILPRLEPPRWVDALSPSILHLSDLHYGSMHAFKPGWGDGKPLVDHVATRIEALEARIGVVVVSGDISSRSEPEGFKQGKEELYQLLERLGLEPKHCVLVPGNHDIDLAKADEQASRRYEHELNYRRFLDDFFGSRGEGDEIESLTIYRTPGELPWTLRFVGLNSVRLRDQETKEYGFVGHRSGPWLERLRQEASDGEAKEAFKARQLHIVVLHHHVLPATPVAPAAKPVSLTVDAAKIIEDCRDSVVHVILNGHQHYPFVASTARAALSHDQQLVLPTPIWVLGAGSGGVEKGLLTDALRENTFGLYEPCDEGLRVRIEKFNPDMEAATWALGVIPL